MVLPDEERYAVTRNQMLDQLAYTMGGRAAEELIFHDPTTGASNDIEKATNLARAMVTQYGMTQRLGAIKLGISDSQPFLGRDYGHQRDYSESIAAVVDGEIRQLIENAHQEAFDILVANRDILDSLVEELLEKETLNKDEIEVVFKKVKKVKKNKTKSHVAILKFIHHGFHRGYLHVCSINGFGRSAFTNVIVG